MRICRRRTLTTLLFAETATAAGFPAGVINIVTGPGSAVGQSLMEHPVVAMVSFTGSTTVGPQVAATAAGAVKQVHLELQCSPDHR
jgi:betaine-aldehyde dehydrogenase